MRVKGFHRTALLAAAPLLALTACQPRDISKQADTTSLTYETPVNGELTTRSPMNLNDGSRYEVVPLRLTPGETTRIALEGALRGRLAVFQDNQLLAASRPMCCGGDPGSAYVVVRTNSDSDYRLGVSGADGNSFGPFRVTASALDARNGGAMAPGETVTGWLNDITANAAIGHVYDVNVTQAGPYEFTLRSDEFDAHLSLTGEALSVENDDGADGSNARLSVLLEPGSYQLKANAVGGPATGLYTLSSATLRLPAGTALQNGGELAPDTSVAGMLGQDALEYGLQLGERRRVVISMQSRQLDSYLTLEGNGVMMENDDGGRNRDARIDTVLEPGTYRIGARAMGGATGMFTLSTQTLDIPGPNGGDIAIGHTGDALLATGGRDVYRLKAERAGHYVIYMGSDSFDALLNIQGNGIDETNDDGGKNYDARLQLELSPGVYTVTATSADGEGGVYRLSVE